MEKVTVSDKLDPNFKFELSARPGGENLKKCFACGTCTGRLPGLPRGARVQPAPHHPHDPAGPARAGPVLQDHLAVLPVLHLLGQLPQDVTSRTSCSPARPGGEGGLRPRRAAREDRAVSTAAHEFRRDCIHLLLARARSAPKR